MGLGKKLRLTRKRDFVEVFTSGDKVTNKHLAVYYLSGKQNKKFACIVSGKVGKPTIRNRVKRAFREEIRLNLDLIPDDLWLIVRMKYPESKYKKVNKTFLKELREEFLTLLKKIIVKVKNDDNFTGVVYTIFTLPIKLYQWLISPLFPPSCKYIPTCSEYSLKAITMYGPIKGTGMAIYRIIRCNPWSRGGYDPP